MMTRLFINQIVEVQWSIASQTQHPAQKMIFRNYLIIVGITAVPMAAQSCKTW